MKTCVMNQILDLADEHGRGPRVSGKSVQFRESGFNIIHCDEGLNERFSGHTANLQAFLGVFSQELLGKQSPAQLGGPAAVAVFVH